MWFFHRKPKLKLHFIDTDYDPIMYLFKQALYLDKIADALVSKDTSPDYALNLMNGFTQIYRLAGKKVQKVHKRKVLPFGEVEEEKLDQATEQVLGPVANIMNIKAKNCSPETLHLLMDIFTFNKEFNANKIVSKTYCHVCTQLRQFAEKMADVTNEREKELEGLYGETLLTFLKTIDKSILFYKKLGKWLCEDKDSFEKYKQYLHKQVGGVHL